MDTKHELWLLYKELEDALSKPLYDSHDASNFKREVEDIKDKLGDIINGI